MRNYTIGVECCQARCPLWVKSRHVQCNRPCPLYPRKRTLPAGSCQKGDLISWSPQSVKVCNERSKFRFQETKDKSELIDCPSLFLHCRQGIEPTRLVSEVAIRSLIDDMIATIDIKRFARDEPRCVVSKKGGGNAHVVDTDKTACRRLRFRLVEQCIKLGNSRCSSRRQRPRRYRMNADALRARVPPRCNGPRIQAPL